MKLNIEVNNKAQSPIADSFFVSIAKKTLEEVRAVKGGKAFGNKESFSISVALVSEEEMQKLNREHRQKDNVTDILSFWEFEGLEGIRGVEDDEVFLGELILCYDDIKKYAAAEGSNLSRELINVVSHGVLHLLGYVHGEEMFFIQKKIANLDIKA